MRIRIHQNTNTPTHNQMMNSSNVDDSKQRTEMTGTTPRFPLRSRSNMGETQRDEERCEREGGRKEETEIGSKIVLRRDETRKNLFRADGRMGDLMKTGGGCLFEIAEVQIQNLKAQNAGEGVQLLGLQVEMQNLDMPS